MLLERQEGRCSEGAVQRMQHGQLGRCCIFHIQPRWTGCTGGHEGASARRGCRCVFHRKYDASGDHHWTGREKERSVDLEQCLSLDISVLSCQCRRCLNGQHYEPHGGLADSASGTAGGLRRVLLIQKVFFKFAAGKALRPSEVTSFCCSQLSWSRINKPLQLSAKFSHLAVAESPLEA